MQRCNSVDDAIFCSNNCRRGINSPGAFTIQNRLFAGGVRSNGAQNFSIEDRMPLDGSGCHVRLSRFLFLFFFFLFFFFTLPRGYCLESGRENRNVQQRPFANDRNAASVFLCFAPSREERTTYETTNTIVSSPRLVSNTFRYVSSPTKSGPSTRRNRVKRNESLSKFPLCRSCRCRFRTSLEIRPRNTIQSV